MLCHAARWNDLVVVERPQLNPDAPTGWGVVSRTVFGSSAPVVVVPESTTLDRAGGDIVVAWNQSREAALAIRGALPLLRLAEHVVVLEGDPVDQPFGLRYLPKLDLRAWLARHGVNAQFRAFNPEKNADKRCSTPRMPNSRPDRDGRVGPFAHHRACARRHDAASFPVERSAAAGCALSKTICVLPTGETFSSFETGDAIDESVDSSRADPDRRNAFACDLCARRTRLICSRCSPTRA